MLILCWGCELTYSSFIGIETSAWVLDGVHYGNISLLGRVLSIKPRLHLFGHVHKANGKVEAHDTLYVNGSIVSSMKMVYKPQRLVIN